MVFDKRLQGAAEKQARRDRRQGFSLLRIVDPLFWLAFICSVFLLTEKYRLNRTEVSFILDNVDKHRKVFWVNIIGGMLVYSGLSELDPEKLPALISVLMAPAFITGGAWFAITFGGVPQKLLDAALVITFWMFSAFTLSLTTMGIVTYFVLEGSPMVLIVIGLINFSVILSAILYDNIDGLKVGLDEALKSNSLANLRFLKHVHEIEPPEEGKELYDDLPIKLER